MKKNKIISLLILCLLVVFLPKTAFGTGSVNKPISIKDALRGQEKVTVLTFSNPGSQEALYKLNAEGATAPWTQFFLSDDKDYKNPVTQVSVPAASFVEIKTRFKIPESVKNGDYKGRIFLSLEAKDDKEKGKSESLAKKTSRNVSINVTDKEIVGFTSTFIPLNYQVDNEHPLHIKILHRNEGNVNIEPMVELKVLKNDVVVDDVIYPYPAQEKAIKPGETRIMSKDLSWRSNELAEGAYKIELAAQVGNFKSRNDFRFVVEPDAASKNDPRNLLYGLSEWNSYNFFGLLLTFSFVLLVSVFWYFYQKRNARIIKKKNDIFPA